MPKKKAWQSAAVFRREFKAWFGSRFRLPAGKKFTQRARWMAFNVPTPEGKIDLIFSTELGAYVYDSDFGHSTVVSVRAWTGDLSGYIAQVDRVSNGFIAYRFVSAPKGKSGKPLYSKSGARPIKPSGKLMGLVRVGHYKGAYYHDRLLAKAPVYKSLGAALDAVMKLVQTA